MKAVTNPLPTAGGADPETAGQARRNAAAGAAALGRLVGVTDYADYARGFAGVEKATARLVSDGRVRRVHVTVAGRDGDEIPAGSPLHTALVRALRRNGDPATPLTVAARRLRFVAVTARVRVHPRYEFPPVEAAVRAALAAALGFDAREFGQPVYQSDVVAAAMAVPGVAAVAVDWFGLIDEFTPDGRRADLPDLIAQLDAVSDNTPDPVLPTFPDRFVGGEVRPAEIAFLSPRVPDLLVLTEWTP